MGKEFIPYEQALALKELGFNEPCMYIFDKQRNNLMCPIYGLFENEEPNRFLNAPLYQQSFRWFREKYSIQSTIEPTKDQHRFELGFNYWIWNTKTGEEWFTEPKNRPAGDYVFDSYEEAELECLKKLIEIVKNN